MKTAQQHNAAFTETETAPDFEIMSNVKWTEYSLYFRMCNKSVSESCDGGTLPLGLLGFWTLSIGTTDMDPVVCLLQAGQTCMVTRLCTMNADWVLLELLLISSITLYITCILLNPSGYITYHQV
jgi:hypothetical protein